MARAFVVVLDSLGCGGAPDAAEFGDLGANTLGHIIQARQGELHVPTLAALGLGEALQHSSGMSSPWPAATLGGMGGGARNLQGQRYPIGPLGIGWGAGAVGLALFSR